MSKKRKRGATPKVRWTDRALADLDAIGDYIARDDPPAAERWVLKLASTAERMASVPRAGRRVPEFERDDLRETFLRSYRIVYRVLAQGIQILTVFEGHQQFPDDVDLDS
jgi:toxin ParE1/3/4